MENPHEMAKQTKQFGSEWEGGLIFIGKDKRQGTESSYIFWDKINEHIMIGEIK